ncbi:uncharacterized protein LOC142554469 [Primulina tabacum]|uniref:uncharacterized protein LOC142554469 n=1 Tax=Primulina tabacum TaxID=48773 RepID=UPI003F59E226
MFARAFSISLLPNSAVVIGWCRSSRRKRRRKDGIIRLGSRRRWFSVGSRSMLRRGVIMATLPFRMLKKILTQIMRNGQLMEVYRWYLPMMRPHLFPLC